VAPKRKLLLLLPPVAIKAGGGDGLVAFRVPAIGALEAGRVAPGLIARGEARRCRDPAAAPVGVEELARAFAGCAMGPRLLREAFGLVA
jgi:hypothetical protein